MGRCCSCRVSAICVWVLCYSSSSAFEDGSMLLSVCKERLLYPRSVPSDGSCATPAAPNEFRGDRSLESTVFQRVFQQPQSSTKEAFATKSRALPCDVSKALEDAVVEFRRLKIGKDPRPADIVRNLLAEATTGLERLQLLGPTEPTDDFAMTERNRVMEILVSALERVNLNKGVTKQQQPEQQQPEQQQHEGQTQSHSDDRLSPGQEKEIQRRLIFSSSAVAAAREHLEEVESSPGVAEDDVHDAEAHLKATLDVHEEWNVDDGGGDFSAWFAAAVQQKEDEILEQQQEDRANQVCENRDRTSHQFRGWNSKLHPPHMRPTLGGLSLPRARVMHVRDTTDSESGRGSDSDA